MLNIKTRNKEKGHSLLIYIKFVLISIENMLKLSPSNETYCSFKKKKEIRLNDGDIDFCCVGGAAAGE